MSEFNKALDVSHLSLVDNHVIVIGEWTVLCGQESRCEEPDVTLSTCSSTDECSDSEPEEDSTRLPRSTHTVTFKVIGCTKESQYQHILQKAQNLIDDHQNISVKLCPEPDNPFDHKAIAFMCKIDGKYQRIGYVVKEVQEAVQAALDADDITQVEFKWVKFISDWYRCGPGYFAGVNVTRKGVWPSVVVRAQSTR